MMNPPHRSHGMAWRQDGFPGDKGNASHLAISSRYSKLLTQAGQIHNQNMIMRVILWVYLAFLRWSSLWPNGVGLPFRRKRTKIWGAKLYGGGLCAVHNATGRSTKRRWISNIFRIAAGLWFEYIGGFLMAGETPKSSMLFSDFPWNKASSYWGTPPICWIIVLDFPAWDDCHWLARGIYVRLVHDVHKYRAFLLASQVNQVCTGRGRAAEQGP